MGKRIYIPVSKDSQVSVLDNQASIDLIKFLWMLRVYDYVAVVNKNDAKQVIILFNRNR